jgi:polysaccharide chain length determinant protein (PEP-CTERM system associated)
VIGVKTIALGHARSLWRRRWYAAGVAWVFCLAGWAYVLTLPDQYQATTRIYVDTDSMLRPLMRGIAVDSNILTQVDLIQRTLLSRPNLQRVSHMADLDLAAHTPSETEAVIGDLRLRTTVSGEGRNLFTISYQGLSRDAATKVVQSLLTVFVESNLGNSRQDIDSARTFIDEQLRNYTQLLDEADKKVAEFKAKNIGYLPGENNYGTRLDAAREDLAKTQAELDDNRQQRAVLAKQLETVPRVVESINAGPGAGPPLGGGPDIGGNTSSTSASPDPNTRVAELEQKLRSLLENDTEQHPDVVRTKRLLERARQEAADAQSLALKNNTPAPLVAPPGGIKTTAPNPVYDQIQIQLVTLDTTIASLESRLRRNQAAVEKWQGLAKEVPEIAAQLSKLLRDYDVTKKAYDELLNRRESAKIGSDLQTQTQTVQFRVVEPPNAPLKPVAPKRPLLLAVVLIAGIIAGGAFAFLLTQVDDSVLTVRQLKELVPLPVLGGISLVTTEAQKRQHVVGALGFLAAALGLIVVCVGIIALAGLTGLSA